MDRLTQLRYFVRTAELGGFSRAALEAGVKPSSVSRAITELETELGAALFNRSTRRLHLTEIGGAFLLRARRILDELEEAYTAASAFNARPQGVLRLNVPGAFGRLHLLPFLPQFAASYPDIGLDVIFHGYDRRHHRDRDRSRHPHRLAAGFTAEGAQTGTASPRALRRTAIFRRARAHRDAVGSTALPRRPVQPAARRPLGADRRSGTA